MSDTDTDHPLADALLEVAEIMDAAPVPTDLKPCDYHRDQLTTILARDGDEGTQTP